ncbi:hypothetical protein NECAME_05927 [Necator americanus]|uniref:Uncharacterized protein n=1 Tax=Necator americanus TaxID=51031 RepID=W2TXF0_NECAM|nr:hypothetical protein NECAME_05927 [Necator americanus]ETN86523.1 hypothetical protein NECAME_05927 [Necator americanus]
MLMEPTDRGPHWKALNDWMQASNQPNPCEHFAAISGVVENVMECHSEDLPIVLKMKPFIDILDYVRDEPFGSKCARAVLTATIQTFQVGSVDDLVIVDRIVEQCSRLCLSIRPDSIQDDIRVVGRIVSSALDRPTMSEDPERYLAFLVRARSLLYQNDDIMATIHLSLLANSRPQTDAILRYSLQVMEDLDVSSAQCLSLYSQFLALLVFIPDQSNDRILDMFNIFVEIIQRKKMPPNSEGFSGDVWMLCLRYLWAASQQEFSVKFMNVQSNDVFYGSSEEYSTAVLEKVDFVMQQLLSLIEIQSTGIPTVALQLLEFAVMRLEIKGPVVKLVSNLLKRCAKSGLFETRVRCIIDDLTKLSETNEEVKQALVKLKLL